MVDTETKKGSLASYLKDQNWCATNLIIQIDYFGQEVYKDKEQTLQYEMVNHNMAVTVTEYDYPMGGHGKMCHVLVYQNGTIKIMTFEKQATRAQYFLNKDKKILYSYFSHTGENRYEIYSLKDNNVEFIGVLNADEYIDDKGNLTYTYRYNGESIQYKEYQEIMKKYINVNAYMTSKEGNLVVIL